MEKQLIIDYIEQNGGTEIPSLQYKFKLSYRQARDIVNEMLSAKKLTYSGGIRFDSTSPRFIVNRPPVTAQSNITPRTEEDRAQQMERFLRELREKRMDELMRTLSGDLEPEVEDWLTKAIAADNNLTLKQALKQAQSELSRAQKSGSTAAATYNNVAFYLSNCDEATFEQIKKRITKK